MKGTKPVHGFEAQQGPSHTSWGSKDGHGHSPGRDEAKLWPIPANKMWVLGLLGLGGRDQLDGPAALGLRKGGVLQGLGVGVVSSRPTPTSCKLRFSTLGQWGSSPGFPPQRNTGAGDFSFLPSLQRPRAGLGRPSPGSSQEGLGPKDSVCRVVDSHE